MDPCQWWVRMDAADVSRPQDMGAEGLKRQAEDARCRREGQNGVLALTCPGRPLTARAGKHR